MPGQHLLAFCFFFPLELMLNSFFLCGVGKCPAGRSHCKNICKSAIGNTRTQGFLAEHCNVLRWSMLFTSPVIWFNIVAGPSIICLSSTLLKTSIKEQNCRLKAGVVLALSIQLNHEENEKCHILKSLCLNSGNTVLLLLKTIVGHDAGSFVSWLLDKVCCRGSCVTSVCVF